MPRGMVTHYAWDVAAHAVTVSLPGPLYDRLLQRATKARRTVEAEVVEAVESQLGEPEELPADMAAAIGALPVLADEDLWRAARQRLAADKATAIEQLHHKRQSEGLSSTEAERLTMLMQEYTRVMLVRSRSAALLQQRGHDVSTLLEEHEP